MWMSELVERSGVARATVKYYLREGLLHPGRSTGATRAVYDDTHVARLRLVRALVHTAGLSLDRVREVLAVVEDDEIGVEASIGAAHHLLAPELDEPVSEQAMQRVRRLGAARRWVPGPGTPHAESVAAALDRMADAGQPLGDDTLQVYADAAMAVARADLAALGVHRDTADATTFAVTGTVLAEPVLLGLRRLCQEHLARSRTAS